MQMKSGRVILPFAAYMNRSWTDRAGGVDDFWYTGSGAVTVLFSDDHGESWRQTPSELLVQTPTLRTYGAIEPVVMQLRDGRLWMLIRTQLGRFYQSYSEDGAEWSRPTPSDIISSDSPAGIVRAADGRLVLLWNKCLRFPYAYGGRHVLHGAVSEDEGRTWIGHREVFRDPLRQEPPPAGGDFGTAYPYPVALRDGRVAFTSGQGHGRVVVMALEPDWLCERSQRDDFSDPAAAEAWSTFGCRGAGVDAGALRITKPDSQWPSGAVRNFPAGRCGVARLSVELHAESGPVSIMLTDHFSVPFDPEDALNAVFVVSTEGFPRGRRCEVELRWDCGRNVCDVLVDGEASGSVRGGRATTGVCYLRIRPLNAVDPAGLTVHGAEVEVE